MEILVVIALVLAIFILLHQPDETEPPQTGEPTPSEVLKRLSELSEHQKDAIRSETKDSGISFACSACDAKSKRYNVADLPLILQNEKFVLLEPSGKILCKACGERHKERMVFDKQTGKPII